MKAIGIVAHSGRAVDRLLENTKQKKRALIVQGIERFFLAYKKFRDKRDYYILDLPGQCKSIGLEFVGAKEVSPGRYVKTYLELPDLLPTFSIDTRLLVSKITIGIVKSELKKKDE
jgi:hypothetical protein